MRQADAGRQLLVVSGLLDAPHYRSHAGLSETEDPAAHYLDRGWRDGLDPCGPFDGAFLLPFYAAAGRAGPPALTWLELSVLPGRRPPMNRAQAEDHASRIRHSPFFDAAAYARRLPPGLDPLLHYVVIGEQLRWQPSPALDPAFYLELHRDVARAGLSPLEHYVEAGARERRRAAPAASRLAFPAVADPGRPTVLVIAHEASRTGAPVLGWNIARLLGQSYNVVAVLLRGGSMEAPFVETAAATVGPLVAEEWQPAEMRRLAERLTDAYRPVFAIANSAETSILVPALARLGVPLVALVHEFATYIRPLSKLRDVLSWAAHIVFPARIVLAAAHRAFPASARRRGIHVLPQGPSRLPAGRHTVAAKPEAGVGPDVFVVLGLGSVHLRKGVDLFIAAAAACVRLAPERRFRFVWIGAGYDPVGDAGYSVYLDAQILQSGLDGMLEMRDEVEDLEPFYARADLFLLASRLDPQPNVAIDAMLRGIPTVCFQGASGTAEILSADPVTQTLVAPHLDAHAAADIICRLAADRTALAAMGAAAARVGAAAYDLDAYVDRVEFWGLAAAASLRPEDLRTLAEAGAVETDFALPPGAEPAALLEREWYVLQQWAVIGGSPDEDDSLQLRRPCAGFHPQAYAHAHAAFCGEGGANPLAHWLRGGRPEGDWLRPVFSPGTAPCPPAALAVALHAHLDDVAHAAELRQRLLRNDAPCDLYLSAATPAQVERLRTCFAGYPGRLALRIAPGQPVARLLAGLANETRQYDIVGHIHDEATADADPAEADRQRAFLWDNLIGDLFPMLDLAVASMTGHAAIGLLMAEDPRLAGWHGTRPLVDALAVQIGAAPPGAFLDFPTAGMFWARPAALQPLLKLDPLDPVTPGVLERLLPCAARAAGFGIGGLRAPGTNW